MEQKLTEEENLKVIALYPHCLCQCMGYEEPQIVSGVDYLNMSVDTCSSFDSVDSDWHVVTDVKLLLRPVSSISDEDAIEVAKMLGREIELDKSRYPDNPFLAGKYEVSDFEKLANIGRREIKQYDNKLPYEVADFIRSKGYALPYKGQSLFDLGIAIDSTLNK